MGKAGWDRVSSRCGEAAPACSSATDWNLLRQACRAGCFVSASVLGSSRLHRNERLPAERTEGSSQVLGSSPAAFTLHVTSHTLRTALCVARPRSLQTSFCPLPASPQ